MTSMSVVLRQPQHIRKIFSGKGKPFDTTTEEIEAASALRQNGDWDTSVKNALSHKANTNESNDHEEQSKSTDLYTLLITKAPYIRGNESALVPTDEISWLDLTLFNHCIAFYRKNFTLVILANTFALMIGLCVKPNSAVILRTGKLHDPELSFQRYLSTIQRIAKFLMFQFDKAKAYKAFGTVRKMHALASKMGKDFSPAPDNLMLHEPWKKEIAEAMKKDLQHIDTSSAPKHLLTWDPPVPVSQFDMATTQFGFIGTMWIFTRVFGVKDREEELKGVIHAWAIFGRLLGIRDEFNVCIKPDAELYDKIFKNIVIDSLKNMDETVITMQSAFVQAFQARVPFMTYKGMLFFSMLDVNGYTGDNLWKLMTYKDKLSFKVMQAWFWGMRNLTICRIFSNLTTGLWLQFQFWLHLSTTLWD